MRKIQEIFDTIVIHLLTQNKKAKDFSACRYKTRDGLKCAVGCLISDEAYDDILENKNVTSIVVKEALRLSNVNAEDHDVNSLLTSCQNIHDGGSIQFWRQDLANLAQIKNLDFNSPKE